MVSLGDKVMDKVSGLVGIAVSRTEYLNGCVQFGVQPKLKKGKTEITTWSVDEEQLVVIGKKSVKIKKFKKKDPPGGPTRKSHGMFSKESIGG